MLQVSKKTLNIRGKILDLTAPVVMGILNVTTDSFFGGSRANSETEIADKVGTMLSEGAAIIDVGGYSTRPGASNIPAEEELGNVISAIETINKYYPAAIISVDTFRSRVAEVAVANGAGLINDVSGGNLDEQMFDVVARLRVPYILMHMRGEPATMNKLTDYDHLIIDIMRDLQSKVASLRSMGVADLIIDPGFGFAKTISQNFELLARLDHFRNLGYPILAGLSRKSTIYKTLKISPDEALNGTTVMNTLALQKGASILRVHDVKAATEAVKLWTAVSNS